jgi:hypothetical protein
MLKLNKLLRRSKYDELRCKFGQLGIDVIGIEEASIKEIQKTYNQIQLLMTEHEELPKGFLNCIRFGEFDDLIERDILGTNSCGVCGTVVPYVENGKISITMFINTEKFRSVEIQKRRELSIKCGPGEYIESTVSHEFGHILEYYLLCRLHKWDEVCPELSIVNGYMATFEDRNCNITSDFVEITEFCVESLKELGYTEKFRILDNACNYLGTYAGYTYIECFAEAFSQYYTSNHPTILSEKIINKYKKFINKL